MKNAVARLKKIKFKENVLKAEVVEDSEEHKNAAKPEVVETLKTNPLKKNENEVARLKKKFKEKRCKG